MSDGRYIDKTGRVVIDKGLYRGWDFSEGLAVAMRKDEKVWGYIDTSGEFAIAPRFASGPNDYVWSFQDGLARIKVNGKFGYVDHSGAFVIKPEIPDGIDFSGGFARVVMEGPCVYFPDGGCGFANPQHVGGSKQQADTACKFTYIDKTGRIITNARFDNGRDSSEGLAPVMIGQQWGYIDKTGTLVVRAQFDDASPFSSGLARIQQHGLYGYADKSGAIKILPQFKYADDFGEGFAVVGDGLDHYWYIDVEGKRTIPGEFRTASPFFKGLAHVKLLPNDASEEEGFAYIDTKGHRVFKY